eukprot:6190576-Pleurochrysis_carterae.AAC.1
MANHASDACVISGRGGSQVRGLPRHADTSLCALPARVGWRRQGRRERVPQADGAVQAHA